jgi:hypothetical protein
MSTELDGLGNLIWHWSPDGLFSVHSIYKFYINLGISRPPISQNMEVKDIAMRKILLMASTLRQTQHDRLPAEEELADHTGMCTM